MGEDEAILASFSIWQLMVRKALSTSDLGILESLFIQTEEILKELKQLLEGCVEPVPKRGRSTANRPTLDLGEKLAAALGLSPGRLRLRVKPVVDHDIGLNPERLFARQMKEESLVLCQEGVAVGAKTEGDGEEEEARLEIIDSESPKRFACSNCQFLTFSTLKGLRRHERLCAGLRPKPDPAGQFPCAKCSRTFSSRRWAAHHESKCDGVEGGGMRTRPIWRRLPGSGELVCAVDGCKTNQTFSAMYGLRAHHLSEHVSEEERGRFRCPECDARFASRARRNDHVRVKHQKRHQCDVCGRRFGEKDKLRGHRLTHTGEKPFACALCPFRTAKKFNLGVHERTKHGKAGNDSFCCEICGRAFATAATLKGHITIVHQRLSDREKKKSNEVNVSQANVELVPASPSSFLLSGLGELEQLDQGVQIEQEISQENTIDATSMVVVAEPVLTPQTVEVSSAASLPTLFGPLIGPELGPNLMGTEGSMNLDQDSNNHLDQQ